MTGPCPDSGVGRCRRRSCATLRSPASGAATRPAPVGVTLARWVVEGWKVVPDDTPSLYLPHDGSEACGDDFPLPRLTDHALDHRGVAVMGPAAPPVRKSVGVSSAAATTSASCPAILVHAGVSALLSQNLIPVYFIVLLSIKMLHPCLNTICLYRARPCPLTVVVSCACRSTRSTLPCGAEAWAMPPRCSKPCPVPQARTAGLQDDSLDDL